MSDERFDKAARAGDSAKGLVHYRNRLQKARLRRRGNARKIAKFERKVQKYNNALAAAAPEYAALEAKVLKKLCSLRKKTVDSELQRGATEEEMRMIGRLVRHMLMVQFNLQAQAYYEAHRIAIEAGEEWEAPSGPNNLLFSDADQLLEASRGGSGCRWSPVPHTPSMRRPSALREPWKPLPSNSCYSSVAC